MCLKKTATARRGPYNKSSSLSCLAWFISHIYIRCWTEKTNTPLPHPLTPIGQIMLQIAAPCRLRDLLFAASSPPHVSLPRSGPHRPCSLLMPRW